LAEKPGKKTKPDPRRNKERKNIFFFSLDPVAGKIFPVFFQFPH